MADWHGYFGLENLALSQAQRQTLIGELRQLGPASDPQPARLCHWRTRLDDQAAIFEALFNEAALTVERWKQRLGAIFGVDPDTIDHSTVHRGFGDDPGATVVITFSRSGVDYLRVALFGAIGSSWQGSGNETRGYLAEYRDEWESTE